MDEVLVSILVDIGAGCALAAVVVLIVVWKETR
jgi:hypothetical protein